MPRSIHAQETIDLVWRLKGYQYLHDCMPCIIKFFVKCSFEEVYSSKEECEDYLECVIILNTETKQWCIWVELHQFFPETTPPAYLYFGDCIFRWDVAGARVVLSLVIKRLKEEVERGLMCSRLKTAKPTQKRSRVEIGHLDFHFE